MRELEYAGNLCFMESRLHCAEQSDIGKGLMVKHLQLTREQKKPPGRGGREVILKQ